MPNDQDPSIDYGALPYRVVLHKDPQDGVWIAQCPELPGVKADGDTQEEALAAVHEVKDLWIQMALEKGHRIPEPAAEPAYSGKLNLRLSRSLHERCAAMARSQGVSLNVFLTSAISERLDRLGYQEVMTSAINSVVETLMQKLPDSGALAWRRCSGTNLKPLTEDEEAHEEPVLVESDS